MKKKKEIEQPDAWTDFVQKYYPDYDHSDEIAHNGDLCKLVDKEYEKGDCADHLLQTEYNGDINNPQIKIDFAFNQECIYREAIINFLNTQQKPKEYYFLFGETASRLYHETDFKAYIKKVKKDNLEFAVHKFVEGEHPENIMEASSGWMDYATISKEEYEQLNELI